MLKLSALVFAASLFTGNAFAASKPAQDGDSAKPQSVQAQCGAMWKAGKVNYIEEGFATWPKFWSHCAKEHRDEKAANKTEKAASEN
jgi:Spy/CpxP family protein refolding chaperone